MSIGLEARLERLLSESRESVLDRERHELERRIGGLDADFILFGAGNLGKKALATLKRLGKKPVAFIDNNSSLWEKDVDGISIMSPVEAKRRFNTTTVGVITTIWCGEATNKMSDRINPLRKLGFEKIALFGHLAWSFPKEFLPHYFLDRPSAIIEQADQVKAAFRLLSEESSRELYVNHIEWRLFLDYDLLPPPSQEQIYFNAKYASNLRTEILYDVGAFTGDSVASFLASKRGSHFAEIHAFEPSPENYAKLEEFLAAVPSSTGKMFPHRAALGNRCQSIQVEAAGGPGARVGKGTATVEMTTIDEFAKSAAPPTFVKIDIEGFERECLEGARQTVADLHPVLAVCVYHRQSDIWRIPLQLNSYSADYQFFLCPHLADGWDLVLYAIPKGRRSIVVNN